MFVFVKFPVNIRILQPEIGAEIKNARAGVEKRLGSLRRETVG